MKIKGEKYEIMKAAMSAALKDHALPITLADLWQLWAMAERNLRYSDEHPGFKSGLWKRIFPQNKNFDTYSEDHNDSHIETALRNIVKEVEKEKS